MPFFLRFVSPDLKAWHNYHPCVASAEHSAFVVLCTQGGVAPCCSQRKNYFRTPNYCWCYLGMSAQPQGKDFCTNYRVDTVTAVSAE